MKKKILIVGQTPPPFGGQAIMINKLLEADFKTLEIYHVRLFFSKDMDEIGRINIRKFFHLLTVILKIIYLRYKYSIEILYYPPSGPDRNSMIRDIVILLLVRPLFKKTVFHFHAAGVSECYEQMNPVMKKIYERAYFRPDLSLYLSNMNPPDPFVLQSKKVILLPNGIKDVFIAQNKKKDRGEKPRILFVGVIRKSKGVEDLVEACKILLDNGKKVEIVFVGKFVSKSYEVSLKEKVRQYQLEDFIKFIGVLVGDEKLEIFYNSDIFCLPTFFESETFGLVLLEAMMFELPIISTKWRGIQDLISVGENGFLIDPHDVNGLAKKIIFLIDNPDYAVEMGKKGRGIFLSKYTEDIFLNKFENAINEI